MNTTTVACRNCGKRFDRPRHAKPVRGLKRTSGGEAAFVETAAYCSNRCRQDAYRIRKDIKAGIPASGRKRRPTKVRLTPRTPVTNAEKSFPDTYAHSPVTRAEIGKEIQRSVTPKKTGLDPLIVPDEKWPGMYRLRLPHDTLSDMLNLVRAKDCARVIREGTQ
jgi:hypothetical protein